MTTAGGNSNRPPICFEGNRFRLQIKSLQCVRCGENYPPIPQASICPRCRDINRPGILDLIEEEPPSSESLRQAILHPELRKGIWAFEDLLPVEAHASWITLGEGHTPLLNAPALAAALGMESLWIKDESRNPTGSFKDRIAAMVVAKAREAGAGRMILVSSGNMASAISAYGALAGLEVVVIVSPAVSRERCIQIAVYGARVIRVNGTSADRLALCLEAAERFGWYNATSPHNPYGPHGAKSISYELYRQGEPEGFDWLFSPVGFGCNIVGNWKGFEDLLRLGLITGIPRLVAVQAEGSPSLVRAFQSGLKEAVPGPQDTIAGGLSQVVTPNSILALKAVRASQGTAVAVSDEEMLSAVLLLARKAGIYAEPSGAAALAALRKMVQRGLVKSRDRVAVLVSGTGLKDPLSSTLIRDLTFPQIDPSLSQLEKSV